MHKLTPIALPLAAASVLPVVAATPAQAASESTIDVYTTGYSWYSNTPVGSAQVAHPVLHSNAGGEGTYSNPITVASLPGRFSFGTRFYVPSLHKYFILEDSGGYTGTKGADAWLDLWVGKGGGSQSSATKCAYGLTGVRTAIVNPGSGYAVYGGDLCDGQRYSDSAPKRAVATVAPKATASAEPKRAVAAPAAPAAPSATTLSASPVGKRAIDAPRPDGYVPFQTAPAAAALLSNPTPQTVEVKAGDTLQSIARAHNTDWKKIYELNKSQIQNPEHIYVGQHFILG